jgi:hypothetical protein
MAKTEVQTLRKQVENLLEQYGNIDRCADEAIDAYVAKAALESPGIPLGVLRQCEFEANARGYSRPLALKRLLQKLLAVSNRRGTRAQLERTSCDAMD